MSAVEDVAVVDRLRELYPGRAAATLIRLQRREKKPIDSGWNVQAVENFTNQIDPEPIIVALAAHLENGGNVGWAIPPGVLVLDADNAESAAWVAETFPDAPRQRTRNGCHVVVKEPPGIDLRQVTQLEIVDGITVDLRASGRGQIAVEPSVHPSGFLYSWEIELPESLAELPDIPAVLVERLRVKEEAQGPVDISEASWREGSRETRLVSMAGRLRSMSLSEVEIRDALMVLNRERCSPQLADRDIARIARSAGKWDRGDDPTHGDALATERAPFELVPFEDLRASIVTDYLVKGVLDRGAMAVMYGQAGSSKSFCALELGMAIASGQKWRGQRVRRGKVAYVAAEGARGIKNRLIAMRDRLALGNIEAIDFYLVERVVSLTGGNADVPLFVEAVQSQVGDQIDLVVIDTLSRSMAGKDENSAADMTQAVAEADGLRQALGCAVLIVHHSGKNEALGARGHSSLRAALETELEVKRAGDAYSLTATKQREHQDGGVWWHELEVIELARDDEGDPVTTCLVRPLDAEPSALFAARVPLAINEERVLQAVLALVQGTPEEAIRDRETVSKDDVRQWVEQNCGVERALRRGVVKKGLEGLKRKGIANSDGEKVFLMRRIEPENETTRGDDMRRISPENEPE